MIENTASAFQAAIDGGYGIETDVQITADGEAMVHHDFALGRLTLGSRQLAAMTAAGLKEVPFKDTADRMMTLGELCDLVAGRVPLLIELKSRFDGDLRLVKRAAEVLKTYAGSGRSDVVRSGRSIAALREIAPGLPRGIVAERHYEHSEWHDLSASQKRSLAFLLHAAAQRPALRRLPREGPALPWPVDCTTYPSACRCSPGRCAARKIVGARGRWADQMIFEGFRP